MGKAVIGLGSNLGNRVLFLCNALKELNEFAGELLAVSSFYETEPVGVTCDHHAYVNAACLIETLLLPEDLLAICNRIEIQFGRLNKHDYHPRFLDLDILFFDNKVIEIDGFTLPHPRLNERWFVLRPLLDIIPNFIHPVSHKTVKELFESL